VTTAAATALTDLQAAVRSAGSVATEALKSSVETASRIGVGMATVARDSAEEGLQVAQRFGAVASQAVRGLIGAQGRAATKTQEASGSTSTSAPPRRKGGRRPTRAARSTG
jgi:hypothetical protein